MAKTKKPEWEDISSYSQREPVEERKPKAWCLSCGAVRIRVHRHIHYPPDTWLLSCDPFFKTHELQAGGLEAAKEEAMGLVMQRLTDEIAQLQKAVT